VDVAQLIAGPGVFICEQCVRDASALAGPRDRARRRRQLSVVPRAREDAKCDFCGKQIAGVERIVAGTSAAICSECLALCRGELAGEHQRSAS
jgi:ATP-dependent protease Clp ATPase subunit